MANNQHIYRKRHNGASHKSIDKHGCQQLQQLQFYCNCLVSVRKRILITINWQT